MAACPVLPHTNPSPCVPQKTQQFLFCLQMEVKMGQGERNTISSE